jgi:hypothetical protein
MRQVVLLILVTLVVTFSTAYARGPYVMATVPGDSNPTVKVAVLDDPANPYRGQYSSLDRWAYEHYSSYVTGENKFFFDLALPNIEEDMKALGLAAKTMTFCSFVELSADGKVAYMVPTLDYTKDPATPELCQPQTLGEVLLPHDYSYPPKENTLPYFWSIGLQDKSVMEEYHRAISTWIAPYYPKITDWMVTNGKDGDLYTFLPDGGVIISSPEVKDDSDHRQSDMRWYKADGNLIKQMNGDYMSWERLISDITWGGENPYMRHKTHFDKSGRKTGTSNNSTGTGRYRAYVNEDHSGFLAVVDYWQNKVLTPEDGDLTQLLVDPYPYFNFIDYIEVVQVYQAQQASLNKS